MHFTFQNMRAFYGPWPRGLGLINLLITRLNSSKSPWELPPPITPVQAHPTHLDGNFVDFLFLPIEGDLGEEVVVAAGPRLHVELGLDGGRRFGVDLKLERRSVLGLIVVHSLQLAHLTYTKRVSITGWLRGYYCSVVYPDPNWTPSQELVK